MSWLESECWSDIAARFHICTDLTLVNIEDGRRKQFLHGTVQGTNNL